MDHEEKTLYFHLESILDQEVSLSRALLASKIQLQIEAASMINIVWQKSKC